MKDIISKEYIKESVLPVVIFFVTLWLFFGVCWLGGAKMWDYWQTLDTTTKAYQNIVNNTPQFIFKLIKVAMNNPIGWITSNTLIITTLAVLGKPR